MAVADRRSWVRRRLDRWRYQEPGRRDVRLDFLRGYAVFAMICDHVAGISWFSPFTGANRFIASAAEGFVLLAGLVIGLVYGRRIVRDGWLPAAEAILHRAAVLYAVTVGLTLTFVAIFQFTDLRLWLDRAYGLGLTDPVELVVGTLTLHYTYHGTDILWMYTIMISVSPLLLLPVVTGRTLQLLAGSWLMWLAYQLFPAQATIPWVATNVNYFPVAAWQVIFISGLALGFHRERIANLFGRWPAGRWLIVFSLGLAFAILIQRAHDTGRLAGWPVVGRLAGDLYYVVFDKPSLAIGRLVAFAIVAGFCYSLATVFWRPLRRALGWLLLPLGTNSLRAYSLHLLLIVVVYNIDVLARLYDRSRTGNTILSVVTVGLTFAIVVGWKRLEGAEEWLPRIPSIAALFHERRYRVGAVVAALAIVGVVGAVVAGPIQVARQATRDAAFREASILRTAPPDGSEAGPRTVVLVLHDDGDTGPRLGQRVLPPVQEAGWGMVAPTVAYRDWSDPEQVVEEAVETLPWLRELVESSGGADAQSPARILVLGVGRGARTAYQLALYYPDLVGGVATVGPAPCIAPATQRSQTPNTPPLPFPLGIDDLEQYVGDERDEGDLTGRYFWLGVGAALDEAGGGCPWGVLAGRPPEERARTFAGLVRQIGAATRIVVDNEAGAADALLDQAVAALRELEGGAVSARGGRLLAGEESRALPR